MTSELQLLSCYSLFPEFSPRFLMSSRSNVFFLHVFAACLTADNYNSLLLVSVCFLFVWTDSDGQTIEKYVGCFMPALNIWPCGTTSVRKGQRCLLTAKYADMHTWPDIKRENCVKKKKKSETKMTFQNICQCIEIYEIEIAWRISI